MHCCLIWACCANAPLARLCSPGAVLPLIALCVCVAASPSCSYAPCKSKMALPRCQLNSALSKRLCFASWAALPDLSCSALLALTAENVARHTPRCLLIVNSE